MATDAANKAHTQLQAEDLLRTSKAGDKFVFTAIGYKENCSVPIIEESQKLYIAAVLAKVLPPALACLSDFILVKAYICPCLSPVYILITCTFYLLPLSSLEGLIGITSRESPLYRGHGGGERRR